MSPALFVWVLAACLCGFSVGASAQAAQCNFAQEAVEIDDAKALIQDFVRLRHREQKMQDLLVRGAAQQRQGQPVNGPDWGNIEAAAQGTAVGQVVSGRRFRQFELTAIRVCFVLSFVAILIYLLLLFRECASLSKDFDNFQVLGSAVLDTVLGLYGEAKRAWNQDPDLEDPLASEIREGVLELRLDLARRGAGLLFDLLAPLIIIVGIMAVHDRLWGHIDHSILDVYLHQWDWVGANILFMVCSVVTAYPAGVTAKSVKIFYVLDTLRMLIFDLHQDTSALIFTFPTTAFGTVVMSFVCGEVWFTATVNYLACAAQCLIYAVAASSTTPSTPAALFPRHVETYVARHIVFVLAVTVMCAIFYKIASEQVRAKLMRSFSLKSEQTAKGLLSVLCDAVVHLDTELNISKPAPMLATLLHMESASRPSAKLEGVPFLSLMQRDDADRFQTYIYKDRVSEREPMQSINVHLKASSGTRINAKLYIGSFQGPNSQIEHIVGICEFEKGTAGLGRLIEGMEEELEYPTRADSALSPGNRREGEGEVMDMLTPLRGQSKGGAVGQEPEVAVCLDANSPELTILGYTPAFAFLTGLMPQRVGILSWIKDPRRFQGSIQDFVEEARSGRPRAKGQKLKVVLRTPLATHLRWEFQARYTLSMEDASPTGEFRGAVASGEGDVLAVSVTFRKVRKRLTSAHQAPQAAEASGSAGPPAREPGGGDAEEAPPEETTSPEEVPDKSPITEQRSVAESDISDTMSDVNSAQLVIPATDKRKKKKKHEPEVAVVIDGMSEELTIIECSPAFAYLSGPVPENEKVGFLGWIRDDDEDSRQTFLDWVQDHVNAYMNSFEHDEPTMSLTLQTPLATNLGLEFGAVCSLVAQDGQEIDENNMFPIRAVLTDVTRRPLQPADS